MLQNKINTITDLIACAHYLVDKKYTSSARLALNGGSAGGIAVGGAITREPGLFGAALDEVGVSDSLRMETTPTGLLNIPELGTTKTLEGFKALYAISPYNHVVRGTPYPAVMLYTGMNDPRLEPWQVAKMAARLQAATTSGKPILLLVDYQGGHGFGDTKTQTDERWADERAFLLWQLGDPAFQLRTPSANSTKDRGKNG
jgi:prolyl oligopeptidase